MVTIDAALTRTAERAPSAVTTAPQPALGNPPPLYLADELGWLRGVDPVSLADDGRDLPVARHHGDPGAPERWRLVRWLVAADGSRLVRLDFPPPGQDLPHHDVTVSIFSDPTDTVGRRFPAPAYPIDAWLSADGRRLVTSSFEASFLDGRVGSSTWHVTDLADGAILSAASFPGYDGERWSWPLLDPQARTAYRLIPLPGGDPIARGGLRLVAIEVATGAIRAALDLPDLRIGRVVLLRGDRIREEVEVGPALALTSDGRMLAVVHPDGRGVTLLDAATLALRRHLVQRRDPGAGADDDPTDAVGQSAWDWPPARTARFGPDGARLYLAGFGPSPDPDDPIATVDYALRVLDLRTGTMRRDPAALAVTELAPTPDGTGVYLAGLRPERWGSPLLVGKAALRRLDPDTLETVAERDDVSLDEIRVLLPWPT